MSWQEDLLKRFSGNKLELSHRFLFKKHVFCIFYCSNLLGTPETSFKGLSTLKVLRVDKSGPLSPSSEAGIKYGRKLQGKNPPFIRQNYRLLKVFIKTYPETTTIKSIMFQGLLR